jgi:PKD repeat protein
VSLAAAILLSAAPAAAAPPQADFTVSPGNPLTLEPVTFRSTSTGTVTSQEWDLDNDGAFDDASGATASRSFAVAGRYLVGLRVEGSGGEESQQKQNVPVANRPPSAGMSWFPGQPVAGSPTNLVSTSQDLDGRLVAEAWDLDGDGAFDDGSGPSVVWTFPEPGAHTVRLLTRDNHGAEATSERAILVGKRVFPLMSPFPTVRLHGAISGSGTLVKRLVVSAPPGAAVEVRCSGPGCGRRAQRRGVAGAARTLRFRRFERRLRPRAALRVYVTKPGTVGKYSRFWFRRRRAPARRDLCVEPGRAKPVRCPGD